MTANQINISTNEVRRHLTNAGINLPEYSDPEFRLMQIQAAIKLLQSLERQLIAEIAINNAAKH